MNTKRHMEAKVLNQMKSAPPRRDLKSDLCKSEGQRSAIAELQAIAEVRRAFGGEIGGIPIRGQAALIGPSGSGKTFIVEQFARSICWPICSTTVSGWTLSNSVSEAWTSRKVLHQLSDSPIIVIIDEIDKVQISAQDNQNWWRACLTEIMMLLDRAAHDWNPTAVQIRNLRQSWILCAGAFQDVYKSKLSGAGSRAAALRSVKIERSDLEEHSGLPTELLNRLGPLIALRPPSDGELMASFMDLERSAGVVIPAKERRSFAQRAIANFQGFRALEEYALFCGRRGCELKKRASPG